MIPAITTKPDSGNQPWLLTSESTFPQETNEPYSRFEEQIQQILAEADTINNDKYC